MSEPFAEYIRDGLCPCCGAVPPTWTPDKIVEAIQGWHERYGSPPTREAWARTGYDHPSTETCDRVFGTLSRATLAAGYVPRKRGGKTKVWTRDKIVEAIHTWARRHGGKPPKMKDWTRTAYDHPTFSTVQNEFGSWNAAIDVAGFIPRGKWGTRIRPTVQPEKIGLVLAEPIGRAIQSELDRGASYDSLAAELGMDESYLRKIVGGKCETIRADFADRIVTGLDQPHLFREAVAA